MSPCPTGTPETRSGGTGLGLSLVKHFIENMGGEVRIMNNSLLPGCTVELILGAAGAEKDRAISRKISK